MQGWAKGLKDRVERTATQISSQATSAFIPPSETNDGNQSGAEPDSHREMGETGDGAGVDRSVPTTPTSSNGSGAGFTESPSMALDRKLKEATSEELISLVKRQSSKLKTMENEYSELKQKGSQQQLERAQEECKLAKDNARELAERYTALQEKFRTLENSAESKQPSAEYNKLLEKTKGLIGKYKEAQGTIKSLQGQVEELRVAQEHKSSVKPEADNDRNEGGSNPDFGATIAVLQDQLREMTRSRDDAEQRMAEAAASKEVGNATVDHIKVQLETKQAENEGLVSQLKELEQRYRNLKEEAEAEAKVAGGSSAVDEAAAADERVADMERKLVVSNERVEELVRRCEEVESEREGIVMSLKSALSRVADQEASAASVEDELCVARDELQAARQEKGEISEKLEAKKAEFENILGKTKDLAGRYRQLQMQAESSASELLSTRQREEQLLAEAEAMRKELAREVDESAAAAKAAVGTSEALREKAQTHIDSLMEQLEVAKRAESEETSALKTQLQQAADEKQKQEEEMEVEMERLRANVMEMSASVEESKAREREAERIAQEMETRLREMKVAAAEQEDKAERGVSERVEVLEKSLEEAVRARAVAEGELQEARANAEAAAAEADNQLGKHETGLRAVEGELAEAREKVAEAESRLAAAGMAAEMREGELNRERVAIEQNLKDEMRDLEAQAKRQSSELTFEKESLQKELLELQDSHDQLSAAVKVAVCKTSDLESQLEAVEGRAREANVTAEEALSAKEAMEKNFQEYKENEASARETAEVQYKRLEDALAEAAQAAEDTRKKLQSELDSEREKNVELVERGSVAEKMAEENASELRVERERAREVEEEAGAMKRRLEERLEAASLGVSDQVSTLETQCSQAQRDRLSAEEEARSLAKQVAGLRNVREDLEGKLVEAKTEAEKIRADGEERARELEKEAQSAKERDAEIVKLSTELENLMTKHDQTTAKAADAAAAATAAEREAEVNISRVRSEVEEVRAALASAKEREALASAKAVKTEDLSDELAAGRKREAELKRLVSDLEAAAQETKRVNEGETEDFRRGLEVARDAADEAQSKVERLAAEIDSSRKELSLEVETLRGRAAAAEEAKQGAVARVNSLEEELSMLQDSAAKVEERYAKAEATLVRAKEAECALVAVREEAARLSHELDEVKATSVSEGERVRLLEAELAGAKAAADEAVGRVQSEREKEVGKAEELTETAKVLEEQLYMARVKAEEVEGRLKEECAKGDALRERAEAAEGRVEKLSGNLQAAVSTCKKMQASKEKVAADHQVELAEIREQLEKSVATSEDLMREEQELRERVGVLESNLEANSAVVKDKTDVLEERIVDLEGVRDEALERAKEAECALVAAREEAAGLSHELDEVKATSVSEGERVRLLEAELADAKAAADEAVGRVQSEREKEVGKAEELTETAKVLEEQLYMARVKAEEVEGRLKEECAKGDALRERAEAAEGRVEKITELCTKLKNSLETFQDELKRTAEDRSALAARVARQSNELADAQVRLDELSIQASEQRTQAQTATERYDNVSAKLKELIIRYKELRDSNATSEANAKRFEAAAIEAEQQASDLRADRDAITEEVGTMRSIVEAADGRLVVLSEEIEKLQQARNKLEGRRVELQMALGTEKLKRAFGVAGATGANADTCEEVFKTWRLVCLEGRQGRIKREAEENRGRAESFEALVQRLSEELEHQGEAVNHHAALIRERESDLEAALDRANRAHEELIAMEPPSLAQAVGSLEILLRVSTESAFSKEGGDVIVQEGGENGDDGVDVIGDRESQNRVWCLVRYLKKKRSSAKSGASSRGHETSIGSVDKKEDDEAGKDRNVGEGYDEKEMNRGGGGGEGEDAPESASSLAETVDDDDDDGHGGDEQSHTVAEVNTVDMKDENSGGNMAAAVDTVEGGGESKDMSPPIPSSVDVAAESTFLLVVEWRTQEEVDEWFASRLAAAIEMEQEHELEHRESEGAEGEPLAAEFDARAPASTMPSALPMLDTPMTIQETFMAKIAGIKAELNSELEKARAELSRNTEAYKQYRARAHTAIKKSGASQREAEARINQAHRDLSAERELVRKALDDRAVAEARWAEEAAILKQNIKELEARVEAATARSAELEAGIALSVEEGVKSARDETVDVKGRLKKQEAATGEAREALATVNAELEKARRELKQRGQLARNLLAEKDAEINRLRSGGGANSVIVGEVAADVNGDALSSSSPLISAPSPPPIGDGSRHQRSLSPSAFPEALTVGSSPGVGGTAAGGTLDGASLAGSSDGGGRKRYQGGGEGGGPHQQQQQTASDSHHAEQQILQMARVQAQRDEEMGRLRVKLQRQAEEIRAREDRLMSRDHDKERLQKKVDDLEAEAKRSKDLLDQEHGREKMTYLKNVVKKFVMSEGTERHRLVPVLATILSFSPTELSEVDKAVSSSGAGSAAGSSWASVFGSG